MAPTLNVWESMGLDEKLTGKAASLRKATAKMMDENFQELNKHVDNTSFPFFLVEKSKDLGIAGLMIKGYGSPGLNNLEAASIYYEMAKKDGSFALFYLAHTSLGMAVISELADEEQKRNWLPAAVKFEKIICFGLTEPFNGSDATGLQTTATKVEGGWRINGRKRWIGSSTIGDLLVWAKNTNDSNKIQAFYVEQGTAGLRVEKIERKYSMRAVQNGDIVLDNVFVPNRNKLAHSKDFSSGTNKILEASRLSIAW